MNHIQKTYLQSLDRVYEIISRGWKETYIPIGIPSATVESKLDRATWLEKFTQFLNRDTSIANTYSQDGKIVGTLSAFQKDNTVRIFSLYVDKNYQGTGIGTALIKHILETYDQDIYVATLEENVSAQEFYRRNGFVPTGVLIPFDF